MNRIDRLHAILTHLQSKKLVTAQEIADRFSISLRTVYRDVKALDESGVPVIGEAGSGYSIMEGYRLPPVMFTQEEAAALLLGGKLAERMTDASVKKHFDAALFKIKAVLRSTDKEHVDNLDDHIAIYRVRRPEDDSSGQYLSALQKAIVERTLIFIRYCSGNNETTERSVEPIGLCYYSGGWHLIGWCRLRGGYRDFLVSRVQRLQVKDESFRHKTHLTLQEYMKTAMDQGELQEAVIRFSKDVIKHLRNQKYYYGFVREEEEEDFVRMFFVTAGFEGFARWILMFTNAATVESPESLKAEMRSLTREIQEHYQ